MKNLPKYTYYDSGKIYSKEQSDVFEAYHDNGQKLCIFNKVGDKWNGLGQWWYKFGVRRHLIQFKQGSNRDSNQHGVSINFNGEKFHWNNDLGNEKIKY